MRPFDTRFSKIWQHSTRLTIPEAQLHIRGFNGSVGGKLSQSLPATNYHQHTPSQGPVRWRLTVYVKGIATKRPARTLLEQIGGGDFHAQLGDGQRRHFVQAGLGGVHALRVWVHQPDVRHAPGLVLLQRRADFAEPVVGR
jgi:hypothetical protein